MISCLVIVSTLQLLSFCKVYKRKLSNRLEELETIQPSLFGAEIIKYYRELKIGVGNLKNMLKIMIGCSKSSLEEQLAYKALTSATFHHRPSTEWEITGSKEEEIFIIGPCGLVDLPLNLMKTLWAHLTASLAHKLFLSGTLSNNLLWKKTAYINLQCC